MGSIKKLASQTLTYGLSTMIGRFINFLLVPLYTSCYEPHEYGIVTDIYALVAFVSVVLVYGMETAFFNFTRNAKYSLKTVYGTGFNTLLSSTLIFLVLGTVFYKQLAVPLGYASSEIYHPEYVLYFIWILGLDALSTLPFALLRQQEKPIRFSVIRLAGIGINVILNLYFLLWAPKLVSDGLSAPFYSESIGLGYIFICNLISSSVTLLLLLPGTLDYGIKADKGLRKDMLRYSWPLIFIGLAGIANETFDRAILKHLGTKEDNLYELGVYGAFYKLSMVMSLFIQAFRFAAEPFFFNQFKEQNAKVLYARIMDYFVMVCCGIYMITLLFVKEISGLLIRNTSYFEHPDGLNIVPVLLLANLFLGVYYSISVWYRLTDNTKKGSVLSIIAALLTILLNVIFIPVFGFIASAWITLLVYFLLALANYIWGQKHYPVPYNLFKLALIITSTIVLTYLAEHSWNGSVSHNYMVNFACLLIYGTILYFIDRKMTTGKKYDRS